MSIGPRTSKAFDVGISTLVESKVLQGGATGAAASANAALNRSLPERVFHALVGG
jgi:hypothetical protein